MHLTKIISWVGILGIGLNLVLAVPASAVTNVASPDAGLSLEVSPSPIVLTLKPAESKTVEVKIYNAGTATENLKIGLQNFTVNKQSSKITLIKGAPPEVSDWVTFDKPNFSIKPAERISLSVTIKTPPSAGFNYNFAMVISRQTAPAAVRGQSAVIGSVAIFTLLNINRPGAQRKLTILSLTTDHKYYEYLPASFTLRLRNDGNSLLLPAGNAYIQRHSNSPNPAAVLAVNPSSLYLLPGVSRDYKFDWRDGLPAYTTTQAAVNAPVERHLEWNWRNSHFRIGKYVARVVTIFDDGVRDVPIESTVSFWVVPWRLLIGAFVGLIVLTIGLGAIFRIVFLMLKRNRFKYRAK